MGGGGVGKSSFIYRYTHNDFTDTLSVMKTLACPTDLYSIDYCWCICFEKVEKIPFFYLGKYTFIVTFFHKILGHGRSG